MQRAASRRGHRWSRPEPLPPPPPVRRVTAAAPSAAVRRAVARARADSVSTPFSAAHFSQSCSSLGAALHDLHEFDHAVALLAVVAQHHATPSRASVGTSRPSSQQEHAVRPRRQTTGCASRRPFLSRGRGPARRRARAAARRWRGRGCLKAHLLIIRPGPRPSARATAVRCCSPPDSSAGRWCIRPLSPTRASSSSARPRACSCLAPPIRRRHHHVLERRELAQQVVELEDEAHRAVAQRAPGRRRAARSLARPR